MTDLERELLHHGASLQALAAALLGNAADADDAVQDTWLLAMQQPPREPGALGGWLQAVLRSVASKFRRNGLRRRRRERVVACMEAQPGADVEAMQRETLRAVVDGVLGLSEPYRTAIWQRFFEGLKPAAMAARNCEALATVKSRLQRGLSLLRHRLDRAGDESADWRQALCGAFGLDQLAPAGSVVVCSATGGLLMGIGGKFALGATAVAFAAAAAFYLCANGTSEPPVPTPGPARGAGTVELAAAPGTPEVPLDRSLGGVSERREVAEPVQPVASTVVVFDADTGRPVPGARVEVVATAALMRALGEAGARLHAPAGRRVRADLAIVATTDDHGAAAMHVPEGALMIEARHDARWGFRAVPSMPDDHRIVLEIGFDRDLRVRVVDQDGQPRADVPVALRRQTEPEPRVRWSGQETVTEPPDGVAVFLHLQRRLQQGPGWHLTFAFPLREPPAVPVDADTPLEPPSELRLPATGGMRLHMRTPGGEVPYLGGIEVQLTAIADGRRLLADGPWANPRLDGKTGEVLVPWLGLDLELQVDLRRAGTVVATTTAMGPRRVGEIVDCDVAWDRAPVRIARGRFVRNDGRPWPACTAEALARLQPMPTDAAGFPDAQQLPVGADGRFALEVQNARPPHGSLGYRFMAPDPDGNGSVMAFVGFDQDVPPEGLDLGDVLLDHGPLLVAGCVVDPGNRPVAGAQLQLHASAPALTQERWRPVFTSGTQRTGDDGRFALFLPRGERDPGDRLGLTARRDGFVAAPARECARGDARLLVVMQPAGGLAGSLVLGDGLAAGDLVVWLVEAATPSLGQLVQVGNDGSFALENLPAGMHSLKVYRRGLDNRPERQPAVVVDGLQVLAGAENRDPRIQQLRIDTVHPTVRIQVVDRNSTPLRGALVSVAGLRNAEPAVADEAGVCRVRAERLPVDLEVTAFGYRARHLQGVADDARVVLDDGIAVQLRAGAQSIGRTPHHRLGVHLYDVDAAGVRRDATYGRAYPWQLRYFDASGELAISVPQPGVYECEVFVYVEGDDHVGRAGPVPMPPPRITVLERGEPQVFDLGIPQAAVDAAVQAVWSRREAPDPGGGR
jgi:RNA polymerase sigma-70 factor (ECF subfamily)